MTKNEALRLAFEALAYINEGANNQGAHTGISWRCAANKSSEALNAIKAALEAKNEPVVWNEGVPAMLPKQKEGETFIVSYEPNQEARDEPVACGACNGSGYMVRDPDIGTDQECFVCEGSGVFKDTTPPQRTWVGLTDEQAMDAYFETPPFGTYKEAFIAGIRFIEAAHGIKGEA